MDYKTPRMATSHPLKTCAQFFAGGQHDFFQPLLRTLQPETLQMKVRKSPRSLAADSIWAEIRTSVPSMNPINFILWFSLKKKCTIMKHGCNWWQGRKGHPTVSYVAGRTRLPRGVPTHPETSCGQQGQLGYLESTNRTSRGRGQGDWRKNSEQRGGAWSGERRWVWLVTGQATKPNHHSWNHSMPLPRHVTSSKLPNHFVPWLPPPMRGGNHGPYCRESTWR